MANIVGKITGPLLESNLIRQGVDLAFDTDLIYLNVNNRRVGINTDIPHRDLLINSDFKTTNLIVDTELQISNFEISGNTISNTDGDILLSAADPGGKITANRLQAGQIEFDGLTIRSTVSNADIEFHTSGSGQVYINELDVIGNLHSTGDIVADGNIVFGDSDTDNVIFNADIGSNITPDITDTYGIGSSSKKFSDLYTYLINGQNVVAAGAVVAGIDLSTRPGNTWYVSNNGNNSNVGDHPNGPFATIEWALSQASSGDTVIIYPGTYVELFPLVVPQGVTVQGSGIRAVKIVPDTASTHEDVFQLNGETTISDLTIADFYYDILNDKGYAFTFAPGFTVTSRSPYIQNVTVITKGSVTSPSDPRGYDQGDAGAGAKIDGSLANAASKEASMLFHSATFITPNSLCIVMKNGVRVEWLNSFIYYAYRGLYAENGTAGFAGLGLSYGAEVRCIGSANVYGQFGVWGDGNAVLMYLINHNFAYIGANKDTNNDPTTAVAENEVVALNNAKIYYQSVDHKGDFRVGDILLIEQETGAVTFTTTAISGTNLTITDGTNTTYIDQQEVQTGNIQITGNNINSLVNGITFAAQNNTITVASNLTVETLNQSQNFITNGNTVIGTDISKILTINSKISSSLVPDTSLENIGSYSRPWNELFSERLLFSDIIVDGNLITTTQSNSDLELRANGSGNIQINDSLSIGQNLNVGGSTFFTNASVTNTLTLNGPLVLTNYSVAEFDNGQILIRDNFITTTESNSNLELRAQSAGGIIIDDTFKVTNSTISNNLLSGTGSQRSIIFAPMPGKIVEISSTEAVKIPIGTNVTRTLSTGELRFNNSVGLYEGSLSGVTLSLNGLYDADRNTYITAELTPGFNDNIIRMVANGVSVADITSDRVRANRVIVDELNFDANTISTFNSNADIELQTSGTGVLNLHDNFIVDSNSITNTVSGSPTTIVTSGTGYVKFDGTGSLRIPFGTDAERPTGVPLGATRYNTDQGYLEVWDGSAWVVSTGGGPVVTNEIMEDLSDVYALIFG
jgi:hypothetical protein